MELVIAIVFSGLALMAAMGLMPASHPNPETQPAISKPNQSVSESPNDPLFDLMRHNAQMVVDQAHAHMQEQLHAIASAIQQNISQSITREFRNAISDSIARIGESDTSKPTVISYKKVSSACLTMCDRVLTAGMYRVEALTHIGQLVDSLYRNQDPQVVMYHLIKGEPKIVRDSVGQTKIRHPTSFVIWTIVGDVYLLDLRVEMDKYHIDDEKQAHIWSNRHNRRNLLPTFYHLPGKGYLSDPLVQTLRSVGEIWHATNHVQHIKQVHGIISEYSQTWNLISGGIMSQSYDSLLANYRRAVEGLEESNKCIAQLTRDLCLRQEQLAATQEQMRNISQVDH